MSWCVALPLALALAAPLEAPGVAPSPAPDLPAEHLWVKANEAYDAGDFALAAARYDELRARGIDNGRLCYNAGNAHLRAGRLGRAVAAFLEARALLPRNSDIAANLAFARSSTKDAIAPPEPPTALRTLFFWHYWLSRRELIWLTLVANLTLWLALALWRLRRFAELNRWLAFAALVVVVGTGASTAVRLSSPRRVAVVLEREVSARAGLSDESAARFMLHEGSEVRVIEQLDDWVRISLPDGNQGWLPTHSVALVDA